MQHFEAREAMFRRQGRKVYFLHVHKARIQALQVIVASLVALAAYENERPVKMSVTLPALPSFPRAQAAGSTVCQLAENNGELLFRENNCNLCAAIGIPVC